MKVIKYILTLSMASLTVLLTSCVTPPSPPQDIALKNKIPMEKNLSSVKTISSWEIQGAMAAKNQNKAWSASMNWIQHGANSYAIRLMGPLGSGNVLIQKTDSTLTFKDGKKTYTSSNAEELLFKHTGIKLPVQNLYYWVRGLPAPGSVAAKQYNKENNLTMLRQNGYNIYFTKYITAKNISLPSMIRLEGNGAMIKVIIKNWIV